MHLNKSRRWQLSGVLAMLNNAESTIEAVLDDERYALGNMPENLESSERFQAMENAVDNLEDAIESIQEAASHVNEAIDN